MNNYLELLYLISFTGILAVAYSYLLSGQIISSSSGNNKMQEIAEAIQIGAKAYLNRQYKTIAVVGFTFEEAIKNGIKAKEFKSEFRALKNTISGNQERTLMKLIIDETSQKVIGAHMIGPDSAEIIQGVAIAIKAGALKSDFDSTIGIHPSAAEEFVTMRS